MINEQLIVNLSLSCVYTFYSFFWLPALVSSQWELSDGRKHTFLLSSFYDNAFSISSFWMMAKVVKFSLEKWYLSGKALFLFCLLRGSEIVKGGWFCCTCFHDLMAIRLQPVNVVRYFTFDAVPNVFLERLSCVTWLRNTGFVTEISCHLFGDLVTTL
jgi:hypothetical protein